MNLSNTKFQLKKKKEFKLQDKSRSSRYNPPLKKQLNNSHLGGSLKNIYSNIHGL